MLRKDSVPSKIGCQPHDLALSGVATHSSTSNYLPPGRTSAVSLKTSAADDDRDAYENCSALSDGSSCSDDGGQRLFEGFTPHQLTARYQPCVTAKLGYDPTEPIRPPHQSKLVNFRRRTKQRGLFGPTSRQEIVRLAPFEKGWKRLVVCISESEGVWNESPSNIIGVTYSSPDGRVCRNLQDIRDTMHRLPTNQQVPLSMFTFRRMFLDYPGAPYQQLVRTRSVLVAQRTLLSNSLDEMRRLEQMEPPLAGRLRWLVKPSYSTSEQANLAKSKSCTRAFSVSSDGEQVSLPVVGDSGSRTSVIGRTASVKRVVICSSNSSSNASIRTQVEPASLEFGLLERARLLLYKGWRRRLICWRPWLCSCGSCSDVLHVFYISPSGFKINSVAQFSAHVSKYSQGRFSANQLSFSRHRLLASPSPSSVPVSSDCSYSNTSYETVIFPRLQPRVLLTRCHVSSSDTVIVPVNGDYSSVVGDVNGHNIGESALPRSYISNRLLRPFIYGWYRRVISCRCSGGVPDSTRVDVCYISPDGEQLNTAGALRYYLNRRGSGGHKMDRQCFLFAPVPLGLNVEYESWLISTELTSASALASAADPAHCRLTPLPDACPICHSPFNARGSDYELSLFRRQRACLWWNGSQRYQNCVVPTPAAHTLPRSSAADLVASLPLPAELVSVDPPPAAVDSHTGAQLLSPPQQQTWCRQDDVVAAEPFRWPFKMSGLDRQNLWQIQKKYDSLKNMSDMEVSAGADAHESDSAGKKLKVAVKKKLQVSEHSVEVIPSCSKVIGTVACAPCTLFCFWEQYGGTIICEPTAQCDCCLCVFHPRCAGLSNHNVERFICCGCALVNSGRLPSLIPPWREITFDELGCPTYLAPQILLSVLGNSGWSEASISKPPPPPPLLRCISRSPTPTQFQQDDECAAVHGKPVRPPPPLLKMAPPSTSAPPTAAQMMGILPRTIASRPPPIGTSRPHTDTTLTLTGVSPPPTSTYPPLTAAHPPPPLMKERDHPQLFSSSPCPPPNAALGLVEPTSPPPGSTIPPVLSRRVITIDHPSVPYQPLSMADASRGTNSFPVDTSLPLHSFPTDSKPDAHPSKLAGLWSKATFAPSNVVTVSKPTTLVSKPAIVVSKPTVFSNLVISKANFASSNVVEVSKPAVVVSKPIVASYHLIAASEPTIVVSKPIFVVSGPTVSSSNVAAVSKPTVSSCKVVIRPLLSSLSTRLAVPPVKLIHPTSRVVRQSTVSDKSAVCSVRSLVTATASPGRSISQSIPTTRLFYRGPVVSPAHSPHKPTIPLSSPAESPIRISSSVITSPRPPYAAPDHTTTKRSASSAQFQPSAKFPSVDIPTRLLSRYTRPSIQPGRKVVRLTPTNSHHDNAAELRSVLKPVVAVGNHNRDTGDVTDGGNAEYRPGVKRSWGSGVSPKPAKRRCFVEETGGTDAL